MVWQMNRQLGSIKVIAILVLGCMVAAALYYLRPTPKTRPLVPSKPPIVTVISVEPVSEVILVNTQGTVRPSREINIVSEVSGRIIEVSPVFAAGGFMAAGDLLVKIDDRELQYRLIEAESQVAAARRELALEKGSARQAKREWRDLGDSEANALSLREPQVFAAQAQLAAAIAQRSQAKLNVERTEIRAPFAGRIQQTQVDIGQFISSGSVVAQVYDSQKAEVRLPLNDQQIGLINLPLGASLQPSQRPNVTLSAIVGGQKHQWPAQIIRTEASIDSTTRFYFAVAEVDQPFDTERYSIPLIMGLFVDVEITGKQFDQIVKVPEKALLNTRSVFIVDDQGVLQQRSVAVINQTNGVVWLQGELSAGEKLVVSDPKVLNAGTVVEAKPLSAPSS